MDNPGARPVLSFLYRTSHFVVKAYQRRERVTQPLDDAAASALDPGRLRTLPRAARIRQVVGDPQLDARLNVRCMSQTLLCFYTGTLMQPLYAGLFKGLSESELDQILSSFSAKQCVPNQGLVDVLSKYMAAPAQGASTGG